MSGLFWITGASSGIGRGLALKVAAQGHPVAVSARNEKALAELAEEARGTIMPYPLDVTDLAACRAAVDRIVADHGPIAHAVLNAGTHTPTPAADFRAEQVKTLVDVNLMGVVNCLDPLLAHCLEQRAGHLAIVSSVAGYRGLPMAGGYCATKAGLIALSESLHAELGPKGIKVQVVCPGFVRTPLTDKNEST